MKTRTKQYLTVLVIAILAVSVYTGSVFAQDNSPGAPTTMLQRMQERWGVEAWTQHVARMTQMRGPEFVGQMMERMAQQESAPCANDEATGPGMGMRQGRMGQGTMDQNGMGRGMMGQGNMDQNGMGRGMMGGGMMGANRQQQGRAWGFWHNTPAATPTPAQ